MSDLKGLARVEFLLKADVEGIHFQPARPDGIAFSAGGPHSIELTLKPAAPEDDPFGSRLGMVCRMTATYAVSAHVVEFIRGLISGMFLPYGPSATELPFVRQGEELISADGQISTGYSPRLNICPQEIQELAAAAELEMMGALERFLGLIRWRQDPDATHNLIDHATLYWRVEEGLYHVLPQRNRGRQRGSAMVGIRWDDDRLAEISRLWEGARVQEPLAHELLREAATVSRTSPRSALLIAAAAAESGVKSHISRTAPDAAWLMDEVPSPPIYKILRDFIPALHSARGRDMSFWTEVVLRLKQVQNLFEIRNKVAHTGCEIGNGISISDAVELVSDLLYIIDVLEGHDWAKQRVSAGLRKRLQWPDPPETRLLIEMYDPRE